MQPGWCQPVRHEFTENECEALPGVAYPGVRDNRSTVDTKTGYDDDDDECAQGIWTASVQSINNQNTFVQHHTSSQVNHRDIGGD